MNKIQQNRRDFLKTSALSALGVGIMGAANFPLQAQALANGDKISSDKLKLDGDEDFRVFGKKDAEVFVIEYASLTCSHCKAFHDNAYKEIKKNYLDSDKIAFILRPFPFDPISLASFALSECKSTENYEKHIDVFFSQQKSFFDRSAHPKDTLMKIAKQIGYTDEEFNKCLSDEKVRNRIIELREFGEKDLKVEATPTIFVGKKGGNADVLIGAADYKTISAIIDKYL